MLPPKPELKMRQKPILSLDFDGVLHLYSSGWQGADRVSDPPVPGAMEFLWNAVDHFRVAIYSTRSHQPGGIHAMREWIGRNFRAFAGPEASECEYRLSLIEYPREKPSAMIGIDDRILTFDGRFPVPKSLLEFKPWNKR